MQTVSALGALLSYLSVGLEPNPDVVQIVWGHGWMHSHLMLLPLAQPLEKLCSNLLVDFPGFGESPLPTEAWGTKEYAVHIAAWLRNVPCKRRIWVGHSFGCRVGIQLAALNPELVNGLFLVAAAGLPPNQSISRRLKVKTKVYFYKALKKGVRFGLSQEWLRKQFGSRDYINAGQLRPIFLKTISEDLAKTAKIVYCPVTLLYGENDTETPPSIGQRYEKIMPNASLTLLPRYDHNSILVEGRHQILHHLTNFMKKVAI